MRTLNLFLAVLVIAGPSSIGANEDLPFILEVTWSGKDHLLLKIDKNAPGANGWREHLEIVVPRRQALVLAREIIKYKSVTEFNNGDSSRMSSPPTTGFLLFGNDSEGPTVEIRLVELFDKRHFVTARVNGVYHFQYPQR